MLHGLARVAVTDRLPVEPEKARGWSAVAAMTLGVAVSKPVRRVIPLGVPNPAVPLCENRTTRVVYGCETVTVGATRLCEAWVYPPELAAMGCELLTPS